MSIAGNNPLLFDSIPDNISLYHYTDGGGLIGILQNKKLWFTNIHYLNDDKEFYYAINLAKKIIDEKYSGLHINYDELINSTFAYFTFSLSAARDTLSQWRGYAPKGGYAVSLKSNILNLMIKNERLQIGKCLYKTEEQEQAIIEHVIGFSPEEYKKCRDNPGDRWPTHIRDAHWHIPSRLVQIAPLLKHSSFLEEEEWRLFTNIGSPIRPNISFPPALTSSLFMPNGNKIKVRARENALIPYLEVSFASEEGMTLYVDEIIVGPTPHKRRALEACRVLVGVSEYINSAAQFTNVTNSTIPFVNW